MLLRLKGHRIADFSNLPYAPFRPSTPLIKGIIYEVVRPVDV